MSRGGESRKRPGGPLVIREMFAFLATDKDGDEGVIGFMDPATQTWMPLVGADEARMSSMRSMARVIARESGEFVRLVRFSTREVVEVIRPDRG